GDGAGGARGGRRPGGAGRGRDRRARRAGGRPRGGGRRRGGRARGGRGGDRGRWLRGAMLPRLRWTVATADRGDHHLGVGQDTDQRGGLGPECHRPPIGGDRGVVAPADHVLPVVGADPDRAPRLAIVYEHVGHLVSVAAGQVGRIAVEDHVAPVSGDIGRPQGEA